jgi:predicted transcriptional regulator
MKRQGTSATAIIDARFYKSDKAKKRLNLARINAAIARDIYKQRKKAGLSQRQLAELVGTSHSVISRLEDEDYTGHSLSILRRISEALKVHLEIRMIGPTRREHVRRTRKTVKVSTD